MGVRVDAMTIVGVRVNDVVVNDLYNPVRAHDV